MSDFFVICFDVCDDKRLRRVAREMENFGARVQKSVFECHLNRSNMAELQQRLAHLIDEEEDSICYYPLCAKDVQAILLDGPGRITFDPDYILLQ